MGVCTVKVLVAIIFGLSAICLASSKPTVSPNALLYIGSVDGKIYLAEMVERNWTDSKQRCEDNGMQFATITNAGQLSVLLTGYSNAGLVGFFWIGARQLSSPDSFLWDQTKEFLNSELFESFNYYGIPHCMNMLIDVSARTNFGLHPCERTFYVVCEMITGK